MGFNRVLVVFWLFTSLLSPVTSHPHHQAAESTCAILSETFPDKVYFPGSLSYTSSVRSYFFRESRQNPTCVIVPKSAQDVSQTIKVLTLSNSTKFSIRGGGHSPNANASNIDNGITIDLSAMTSITPRGATWKVVELGPGVTAGHVYRALDQHGRTVVGARVASVGMAGFLSGGGLSFFSPERGWGCDSVVNIQVVLASGSIVNANATSHPDLFRALKGGQNNFGIATRLDVETYPQSEYWGGAIQYPARADDAQLKAFTAFRSEQIYDPYATIEQTFIYYGSTRTFFSSNGMFYTKPVVNASALRFFTEIQPQLSSTMRVSNTTDFSSEIQTLQPTDSYGIYATSTITISPTILNKIHSLWKSATNELASIENFTSVLTFQPIPPPAPASNPNSLGFAPYSTSHKDTINALVSVYWATSYNTSKIGSVVEALLASIDGVAEEEGVLHPFKYINYATTKFQKPIETYGKEQVAFMRRVAEKYDPGRVFQLQAFGGFKLT